jgi:hypothetical protein
VSSPEPTRPKAGRSAPPADAPARPAFPGARAFVVMLRADCDPTRDDVRGRVEHVRSGRTTHFGSLAELVAFVAMVTSDDGAGR